MREILAVALLLGGAGLAPASAPPARDRIAGYFRGWYAHIPGSEVSVKPATDVTLPGLEAYMVGRTSSSKSFQEQNLVFADKGGEIFVGDVLGDPARAATKHPFDPGHDLPDVEASLAEIFGLPVKVVLGSTERGSLIPMTISVPLDKEGQVLAARPGFIAKDGSALLLGEFHSLAEGPSAFRQRLLAQSEGVRVGTGRFVVTEFLDFQCDRCRTRTPDVRRAVEERGGAVEVRFLPLVKTHDWAFAAAESAAALAGVRPELYRKFEETIFARAEGMNAAAARELAADIAEAGGAKEAYAAELSSGRAREHVARDFSLAMRLGIISTPSFVLKGTYLPGERGILETFLWESFPPAAKGPTQPPQ